jgi:hypothetical protein
MPSYSAVWANERALPTGLSESLVEVRLPSAS